MLVACKCYAELFFGVVPSDLHVILARGRSGRSNAAKIECAHMRACNFLTDYNQTILTFHSIDDYFALLKGF